MTTFILSLVLLSGCYDDSAPTLTESDESPAAEKPEDFWSPFQGILDIGIVKHKFKGKYGEFSHNSFDYKKLVKHKDFKSLLNKQKEALAKTNPPANRDDKLAFWINCYNFFTIADVTANLPTESMKDIGWKNERHEVGGKKFSLDQIEHGVIRKMNEAKIHFAVNCASVSCPSLYEKVFHGKALNQTLKSLTENALKNPLHIRIDGSDIEVTKLMDWFEKDFEKKPYSSPQGFIKVHAPKALHKEIDGYLHYDWDMNTPENVKKAILKLGVKEVK